MTGFVITRLGPGDAILHAAMQALYGDAFEDQQRDCGERPDAAYVRGVLDQPLTIALVARQGDLVVGALTAYELCKLERRVSEIYIYDLAVASSHRRQGIATRLIEAVRDIARTRRAAGVFVQADVDDAPAIALYETCGRRTDVFHFDIDGVAA